MELNPVNQITYHRGDLTKIPLDGKNAIIAHVCNNIGKWGVGFTAALDLRWPTCGIAFKDWAKWGEEDGVIYQLGNNQIVPVGPRTYVINMVAQDGVYHREKNRHPLSYDFLEICLNKLARTALQLEANIYMPIIGIGYGRGKWPLIEPMIEEILVKPGHIVNVVALST